MKKNIQIYDFSSIIEDSSKKLVLIIYDIIETKTRNKMVKLLESYGNRVQKSAFEALLFPAQYSDIIDRICCIINEEDNVRIYRLNSSNEVVLIGTSDTIYEEDVIIV